MKICADWSTAADRLRLVSATHLASFSGGWQARAQVVRMEQGCLRAVLISGRGLMEGCLKTPESSA